MKLPFVMEIYSELVSRGILSGLHPPKDVLELTNMLDMATKGRASHTSMGKIFIWNVDVSPPTSLKELLNKQHIDFIGAMGTSAKVMAGKEKIDLDFTYGVIDKCILKALVNKNSLIITSGGMVQHALRRVKGYCKDYGVVIEAILLTAKQTF